MPPRIDVRLRVLTRLASVLPREIPVQYDVPSNDSGGSSSKRPPLTRANRFPRPCRIPLEVAIPFVSRRPPLPASLNDFRFRKQGRPPDLLPLSIHKICYHGGMGMSKVHCRESHQGRDGQAEWQAARQSGSGTVLVIANRLHHDGVYDIDGTRCKRPAGSRNSPRIP
ncbi:hypothetical protein LX32DRAFT_371494 [Colletotrichum zoysiae]|uniref:Uncharacterized protein n=1 Tax=Colletotrichum zoysiae TaxID=1216348 RepID=A0AAD9HT60_9PEZI|nr:hypothetical protein LX32DRAFT_371494 [Colletotrichum zoysiae]